MDAWSRLINYWDREWKGDSFNGRCLRDELAAQTANQVVDADTLEGFTVWGVALHVHRYKEIFLARLEGRAPGFPEGDQDFPPVPKDRVTEARWQAALARMEATHDALSARARTLDERFLDRSFDGGEMTWAEGLISVFTHDFYHVAQIRNMRGPSSKTPL